MARNKNAYPPEFWSKVYDDYNNNGLTFPELRDKYGLAKSSISYRFKKDGIKTRARKKAESLHIKAVHNKYKRSIGPRDKLLGKRYIHSKTTQNPFTGCWEWTGVPTSEGNGQLMIDGKRWISHRYAYKVYNGDFDESLYIHQGCKNKMCCNPDHLSIVTPSQSRHHTSVSAIKTEHVEVLRAKFYNGLISRKDIATICSTSIESVYRMLNHRTFKYIGGPKEMVRSKKEAIAFIRENDFDTSRKETGCSRKFFDRINEIGG